ncbi:MAG: protein tyrosine phosphatase family protein, partial [Luminiphilus sp.]|nr:protein tyrosine phosphatase family protein [Luminiphilus sp.]
EAQFSLVKEAGYTTVINLAPESHENALGNEDEILERMGIRYIHLPVVFTNPTREDFDRFVDALESCDDDRIWVHCAANMRVSAFVFKYRTERLGWSSHEAETDLHRIWEPGKVMGVWQTFIDTA